MWRNAYSFANSKKVYKASPYIAEKYVKSTFPSVHLAQEKIWIVKFSHVRSQLGILLMFKV